MYKTIKELLPTTTLSKAQVDRNYYRIKDTYAASGLIYQDENRIRYIHESICHLVTQRRRTRIFTKEDVNALFHEDWNYFITYRPKDHVTKQHCHAMMQLLVNHLGEQHDGAIKLIYFIEHPDTDIHIHFLLSVVDYPDLKRSVENYLRKSIECNTLVETYEPELGERCKSYITKELKQHEENWGWLER